MGWPPPWRSAPGVSSYSTHPSSGASTDMAPLSRSTDSASTHDQIRAKAKEAHLLSMIPQFWLSLPNSTLQTCLSPKPNQYFIYTQRDQDICPRTSRFHTIVAHLDITLADARVLQHVLATSRFASARTTLRATLSKPHNRLCVVSPRSAHCDQILCR